MYKRNDNSIGAKLSQWFPAHNGQIKVRRTYGWQCPYCDYTSNKRFNTQRHSYTRHGDGEPIDSRTGETMAQKKAAALHAHKYPNMQSSNLMPDTNLITSFQPKESSEMKAADTQAYTPRTGSENIRHIQNVPKDTTEEGRYLMPFLGAQLKRVWDLGYNVPTPSQSLGGLDSKFKGPSMHPIKIPVAQRTQNYKNNSDVDYVDQLSAYDPAMALWKKGRAIANLFKNV
jgi:hypothetical protein